MSEQKLKLKTGGMAKKAVSAYQKIEDTFVGGYKKVENAFVDSFLEKEEDAETSSLDDITSEETR